MQTNSVVNCPQCRGDRGPRRSTPGLPYWLSPLLLALMLAATSRAAHAQVDPGTAQTKPNQPAPTAATAALTPTTVVLTTIRDDQGLLTAAVPSAWNQVAQGEWRIAGAPAGRLLSASPNQGDFATNWSTPGIALYYSTSLPVAMEPEDLLGIFDYSSTCQDGGRGTLPPGQRSVTYQIWQNCGGTGTAAAVLVVAPAARDFYAVVEVYLTGIEDLRALGPILRTVQFGPSAAAGPPAAGSATGAQPGGEAGTDAAAPTATLPPPSPTPEPSPTPVPVLATVTTDRLNLRSGPSTAVPRLTVVTRGMQLTVTGQLGNCAWLRVTAPDGQGGWVSGDPQFTTLGAACATIPIVESP